MPAFDAAAALVRLVSLLGQGLASLAEIVDAMEPMPIVHDDVATPIEQKGLIMRTLMEQLTEEGAEPVLVDGIKVVSEEGWVLVVPDPEDPITHVWAEASDLAHSEALASVYAQRITRMMA
jgi:mannose-1-phosphate guanylyltransferase/phosphomannomutase